MTRPIFLLTDFGLADTYVGVVKAVILGIAPDARIVDLTHDIPPQDIQAGAFALLTAVPYLPGDAVVLAVVDPGVGTARRPIAVEVDGYLFVGPDNGLLSWAITAVQQARQDPGRLLPSASPANHLADPGRLPRSLAREMMSATRGSGEAEGPRARWTPICASRSEAGGEGLPAGGAGRRAVVLDRPQFWRPIVSPTFHGRDLFGPVAAHLARGVPLAEVGTPTDSIQTRPFPRPSLERDASGQVRAASGEVIHVDRFGTLITSLTADDLPAEPIVEVAGRAIRGLARTFQDRPAGDAHAGGLIALVGSAGFLEVAVPNGSAAAILGIGVGNVVRARTTGTVSS